MTADKRARDLDVGDLFREYGMDDVHKVEALGPDAGDTILLHVVRRTELLSLDGDTIVVDLNAAPVRVAGTIHLANGETVEFDIGDVAGDIAWNQWGNAPAVLSGSADLVDAMTDAVRDGEHLVVIS